MEQGPDLYENPGLPIPENEIDYVFLTHAHIDHSGMLPKLAKNGFKGQIFTTFATADLCNIMLRDSAHIQEFEAEWRNRKGRRAGKPEFEPVYVMQDALDAIELLVPCGYGERITICDGIQIRFTDVGHLLGSASIEVWATEGDVTKKIVFSPTGARELKVMLAAVTRILEITINAFLDNDVAAAYRVEPLEELIDNLCDEMKLHHIDRLQTGECTLNHGFAFNDLLTNCERVSDHCSNIAVAMIELESDSFDTHEYINSVMAMHSHSFDEYYSEYSKEFQI